MARIPKTPWALPSAAALDRLVGWHLAVRLDAVLEAEELPASIADLDATLRGLRAQPYARTARTKLRQSETCIMNGSYGVKRVCSFTGACPMWMQIASRMAAKRRSQRRASEVTS